jgi:predicted alpha/beta-hydrolase family hydrolase
MSPLVFETPLDGTAGLPATLYPAAPGDIRDLVLVLAHGAGAGQHSAWMRRYAEGLAGHGLDIVTFDFPYMAAGRKAPDPAPRALDAFAAVLRGVVAHRHIKASRLAIGGKSMGGRLATMLAAEPARWPDGRALAGVVAFGYPLKPPTYTGGDRVSHLARLAAPALVVQGTRDSFGGPDDIRAACTAAPRVEVVAVEGGDHSLEVRRKDGRNQADVDRQVWATVAHWICR